MAILEIIAFPMKKYYYIYRLRLMLILLGLALLLALNSLAFSQQWQFWFFVGVISLTGIPHGSMDFYLDKKVKEIDNVQFNIFKFYTVYLLKIVAYVVCWIYLPIPSLLFFLVITALHFGEIDWMKHKESVLNSVLYITYGSLMIISLITAHFNETAPILFDIVKQKNHQAQAVWFSISLSKYGLLIWSSYFILLFFLRKKIDWTSKEYILFVLQTVVLLFLIYLLPFYLGFAFYFGFWHSILSLDIIKSVVQLNDKRFNWFMMVKKAFPFILVALLFVGVVIFSRLPVNNGQIIPGLFIGISALTLPHLYVFSGAVKRHVR